jgi:hypothetical protein
MQSMILHRLLPAALALGLSLGGTAALAAPAAFETPEAAVEALVSALRAQDRAAVLAVFGPESEDVISSGDPRRDSDDREDFLAAHDAMNRVAVDAAGTATLYIGREQWPFPIRLARTDAGWSFDVEGGRVELLERRIGRNELDVIDLMRAYAEVQARFRRIDWDGDGVMEFAAHILSTPGTRDGLYWPPEDGAPESPIGDAVARAAAEGYATDAGDAEPEPYLGYYFHVLQRQGPNAPGGALEYMVNGNMVAGHALIAFPAAYGESGVMSFMVGENGTVYEADLGPDTIAAATAIEAFDPEGAWAPTDAP